MHSVKVATFNVENLFARFHFNKRVKDYNKILTDGWTINHTYFTIFNETEKKITAETIKAVDADIIALQEVENLDVLRKFRDLYLGGRKAYPYCLVLDGNDPRRIDVAVMSRYPFDNIHSHIDLWSPELKYFVFSRDCLVVDVQLPGEAKLTLFVNHLKSMLDQKDPANGRKNTREKRLVQSRKVKQIVSSKFGAEPGKHPFIVLGDFNDYLEKDEQGETGIADLVNWDQVVNVVDRLPKTERWTHYFKGKGNNPAAYKQLDYLLLSKSLADANPEAPYIERRGMPKRAEKVKVDRFTGVGNNTPKASDHCPLVMELVF